MKRFDLSQTVGGWFAGNFEPTFLRNEDFEICVKRYRKGDTEPTHYQVSATEITVIISGKARMGEELLEMDEAIIIEPLEAYDFEALSDVVLIAIKTPSLPEDKKVGLPWAPYN